MREVVTLPSASVTSRVPKNAKVGLNDPVLLLMLKTKGKFTVSPSSHVKHSSMSNVASTTNKSFETQLFSSGKGGV